VRQKVAYGLDDELMDRLFFLGRNNLQTLGHVPGKVSRKELGVFAIRSALSHSALAALYGGG
jgi:hypothetical protein